MKYKVYTLSLFFCRKKLNFYGLVKSTSCMRKYSNLEGKRILQTEISIQRSSITFPYILSGWQIAFYKYLLCTHGIIC